MEAFYPFFLAIFAGVFFSMIARKTHIPWVVALLAGGIILGPNVFDILEINPTIEFIGQIGLIFLMFMAGLETDMSDLKEFRWKLGFLAFMNGAIPFVVGAGIGLLLGYTLLPSLILGVVFISSSIAVVIPSLESHKLLHTRLRKSRVMGNHDEHLLHPELVQGLGRWVADMTEWCAAQLSEADRAYLGSFQPLIEVQATDAAQPRIDVDWIFMAADRYDSDTQATVIPDYGTR